MAKIYIYIFSTHTGVVTAPPFYSYSNKFQCFWSIIREYTYTNLHAINKVYNDLL